jgi:hypothetical protein
VSFQRPCKWFAPLRFTAAYPATAGEDGKGRSELCSQRGFLTSHLHKVSAWQVAMVEWFNKTIPKIFIRSRTCSSFGMFFEFSNKP